MVEVDVYRAFRERIGLFENVVGRLQPILARLQALISGRVLGGQTRDPSDRQATVNEIEMEAAQAREGGFDIDAVTDEDLIEPVRPPSPVTMAQLEQVIATPDLLPPGVEAVALGAREYAFRQPGLARPVRVSTDPAYYEQNADTVELWSPGNPTFPAPQDVPEEPLVVTGLAELLRQHAASPASPPSSGPGAMAAASSDLSS